MLILRVTIILTAILRIISQGLTSSDEEAQEQPIASNKKKRVDEKLKKLLQKHSGRWPDYKLRAWASMLV